MFKDILTFLGLNYKKSFAFNIVLCCPRDQYPKISSDNYIKLKFVVEKFNPQHVQKIKNGRTDMQVTIMEMLRFLNRT